MRQLFSVFIALLALLIPGFAIFGLIENAATLPLWQWLMISAIGTSLSGALYKPRCWRKSALTWGLMGTGGLAGLVGYLYARTMLFPTGFLFRMELAISFLGGAFPGLLLHKYWFKSVLSR